MPQDAESSITNFSMAATPSTAAPTNIPNGPGIPAMTTEQRENPVPPLQKWTDTYAAQIAIGDFKKAEAYRTINHDWRFRVSDQLYLAWTQRKTWEGTKIPRSSVGIFTALEQVEALLPSFLLALFPDNNRLPFDVEPQPGTSLAQAQAVRDLQAWQLMDISDPGKFVTLREVARRAYKSSYIYGNGPVEFGVYDKNIATTKYQRLQIPIRQSIQHPLTGENVSVPTGQFRSLAVPQQSFQRVVKPVLWNTDIRDYYWDPNCPTHNPNDGVYCATRHLWSIDQIEEYRGIPGFNLPDRKQLLQLAQIKITSQGDTTKMNQESFRGMTWQPAIDYTVAPNLQRLEVIRYWQKNHHVWLLGRQWVAYNEINHFGMLPFLDAFYVDVPGRFAGLSICDLVEGDQKLAEAIINARIDELNLHIHPPLIVKEGRAFSASQQRLRPGVVWKVESPADDVKWMDNNPVTQDAYLEVNALEMRVQKKTGVTDLAVLGTPTAGGNSANRTATGVSAQEGSSGKRIQYHVENAEDQFIVPALNIMHKLNQIFLPLDQIQQVLGPEGQQIVIDPVDIVNADVRFIMNASSKMRIRNQLASGGLGLILQTYMNPELLTLASDLGLKLDFLQIQRTVNDTFGLSPRAFFAPMTPQEQQMQQQRRMAPLQAKLAEQGQRLQSNEKIHEGRDETTLIKALLDRIVTPDVAHQLLNEFAGAKLTLPSDIPPQQNAGTGSNQSGA